MIVIAVDPQENESGVLTALQDWKRLAVPTKRSNGRAFRSSRVLFAYITDRSGVPRRESLPDHLRRIAKQELGTDMGDRLIEIADELEEG